MITPTEVVVLRSHVERQGAILEPWATMLLDTVEQLYHERAEAREIVTQMVCGTPGSAEVAFDLTRKWFAETLTPEER